MKLKNARKVALLKKSLAKTKGLSFLQKNLMQKSLWRFSYSSVAKALFIGMFWMMIPMPFQMIPAAIMCVMFRANIPLAITCVWISNPVTWIPIYFSNYVLGTILLNEHINISDGNSCANYVLDHIDDFWQPLYLGSFVGGILLGLGCFIFIHILRIIREK